MASVLKTMSLINSFKDYDNAKRRLFVRLMNRKDVTDTDFWYPLAGDIVMVLYCLLEVTDSETAASLRLQRTFEECTSESWPRDPDRLLVDACLNTGLLFPTVFSVSNDDMTDLDRFHPYSNAVQTSLEKFNMIGLTDSMRANGSAAVVVPGVMDRVCEVFNEDVVKIAFVDRGSANISPGWSSNDDLLYALTELDNETNAAVSRKIYAYDRRTKQFTVAAEEDVAKFAVHIMEP